MAFKFLDSECPDEFIRALAVERLRELRDDEVADYLLQLVQVKEHYQTVEDIPCIYRH